MKQIFIKRSVAILALLLAATSLTFAQKLPKPAISENNVRAEMNFLAGDAMMGRAGGSGI